MISTKLYSQFVLLLLLFVFVFSCGQKTDKGKLENNVYINKDFGLELIIPNDWNARYGKPDQLSSENVVDKLIEQNPWFDNLIEENNLNEIEYLILKNEKGSQFSVLSESVKRTTVVSSYGYLEYLKLQLGNFKIGPHKQEIKIQPDTSIINGHKFESLDWIIHFPDFNLQHKYFVRLVGNKVLILHLVTRNQNSNEVFNSLISQIRWN